MRGKKFGVLVHGNVTLVHVYMTLVYSSSAGSGRNRFGLTRRISGTSGYLKCHSGGGA